MSAPSTTSSSPDPKRVVVKLSHSQSLPKLPFELRDHVSPNVWAVRASSLVRLASLYYRPNFDIFYMTTTILLTLFVPVGTHIFITQALEKNAKVEDVQSITWLARICFLAVMLATWLVLCVPILLWKRMGSVRATKLAEEWTRIDAIIPAAYGAAPVWTVVTPGMFRGIVALRVTIPTVKKSHFDRMSYLPPYIAAGADGLPSYGETGMVSLSKNSNGEMKFGDIPIYSDDMTVVQV